MQSVKDNEFIYEEYGGMYIAGMSVLGDRDEQQDRALVIFAMITRCF